MAHDDATRGLQRAGEAPVGQAALRAVAGLPALTSRAPRRLWQLPGRGGQAEGEGRAAALRPLLLPLPQRRVRRGRVRPHDHLRGARLRHGSAAAAGWTC